MKNIIPAKILFLIITSLVFVQFHAHSQGSTYDNDDINIYNSYEGTINSDNDLIDSVETSANLRNISSELENESASEDINESTSGQTSTAPSLGSSTHEDEKESDASQESSEADTDLTSLETES